jgi:uncharacterized protein YggU (UPF0235/DUF167 family)
MTVKNSGDVQIRVTTGVKRSSIAVGAKGILQVSVKAPPKGGRANDMVREIVAKYFSVPLKDIHIVRGGTSRAKILRVYAP